MTDDTGKQNAGEAPAAPLKPITIKAAPIADPGQAPAPGIPRPIAKEETSKISLDAAKPVATPKTIRIKPTPADTINILNTTAKPASPVVPGTSEEKIEAKHKTSRIPLEAAMGASDEPGGGEGGAKTIKLKRPGGAPTVQVGAPAAAAAGADADKDAMGKTARLDEGDADAAPTPTRKKTIRIKRPTQQTGVKTLAVKRPGEEVEEDQVQATPPGPGQSMPVAPAPADEPSWAFSVVAIAAILVSCVLIYVLAAQCFGPDSCLTRLSYGARGMDLGWPGKISAVR